MLEKKWPLFCLNALRKPEAWRRLYDHRLDESFYGTEAQLLERIGREAGFKVVPPGGPEMKAWTDRHHFLQKGAAPRRLVELIDRIQDNRWTLILEEDTIRVVPREAAVTFWKDWWASTPRK